MKSRNRLPEHRDFEELEGPAAAIGIVMACGLLAANLWVFTLVY